MKENIFVMIFHRIKSLIRKMLSLTFLTWAVVSYFWIFRLKQPLDISYLTFTGVMAIGKSYIDIQKSKTGGSV